MKKLFIILTLLLSLLLAATGWAAASLTDNAQLLTATQKQQVLAVLKQQEQAHHVRIAVVTMDSIGNNKVSSYATRLLDRNFTDGAKGNMLLLQVVDQRQWYIVTDAKLQSTMGTSASVKYLSNAFVPKMSQGDYASAYLTFAQKSGELLSYYEQNGSNAAATTAGYLNRQQSAAQRQAVAATAAEEKEQDPEMPILFAVVGGGVLAILVRSSLLASMSNVQAQAAADAYLKRDSFELTHSNDTYLYSNVAVVPVSNGNGPGGHGGGGGGHGGGGGGY